LIAACVAAARLCAARSLSAFDRTRPSPGRPRLLARASAMTGSASSRSRTFYSRNGGVFGVGWVWGHCFGGPPAAAPFEKGGGAFGVGLGGFRGVALVSPPAGVRGPLAV
jgi:hypothetical protein